MKQAEHHTITERHSQNEQRSTKVTVPETMPRYANPPVKLTILPESYLFQFLARFLQALFGEQFCNLDG
jgi:hypothetical protein